VQSSPLRENRESETQEQKWQGKEENARKKIRYRQKRNGKHSYLRIRIEVLTAVIMKTTVSGI
jgi:hypothetical protein